MLISVPATSSELTSLLSAAQKTVFAKHISLPGKKSVTLQNTHASYDIYLELDDTAVVGSGILIPAANGEYVWTGEEYPVFNLISNGGTNNQIALINA